MKMYPKKKTTTTAPPPSMSMLPSSLSSSSSTLSPSLLMLLLLFSFITFTPVSADGNTYIINNAPDFIEFAKKVNNDRTTSSGITVLLNGDIDFSSCSDDFEPVGDYSNTYFTGAFYGQGHTITNLVVNSSDFRYTGLFGYSSRLTFKSLIIDSSCSFTSYYNPSSSSYNDAFVSSVVGFCGASGNTCAIEGVVNMADVSYLHGSRSYVIAGGIVAKCTGNCVLTNIVNFGSVLTASDSSSNCIYSGGIVGETNGISGFGSIRNCINYGTVTNTIQGKEYMSVGGIAGVVWPNAAIENCLAAGSVSSVESSTNSYTGSIIGGAGSSSISPPNNTIINCFWTEGAGSLNVSGQVIDNTTVLNTTNTSIIEMNESTLAMIRDTMNTGTSSECEWVTVHLNGGRFGNSTQEDLLLLQKSFITDPVKEEHSFVTWCNDPECTTSCNSSSVGECTSAELYAAWAINNYTLTIDFDNGTVVDVEIEFNNTINITRPTREGHKFIGWNDTIPTSMPAHNIAIKAIWVNATSPSESVEIVFGTKDLSNDEINEIIQKHAGGSGYEITNTIRTTDGISVIVKFNDATEAMNFVENISESGKMDGVIVRISFIDEGVGSFSVCFVPSLLLILFVMFSILV